MRRRVISVIAAVALGLVVWFLNSEWLNQDVCLDGGGRWDSEMKVCQYAG
jgi:hypothetical protein